VGFYTLQGELNGWSGLTNLELLSVTCRVPGISGAVIKRIWKQGQSAPLKMPDVLPKSVRLTLRQESWSARGWSKDSPGFVFWAALERAQGPRLLHGENMISGIEEDVEQGKESKDSFIAPMSPWSSVKKKIGSGMLKAGNVFSKMPQATKAHMVAHRYASAKESAKDQLTYHALLLLEWDHGLYSSVIELAWWNGLGGYGGKSNWVSDLPHPMLYQVTFYEMKEP